MIVIVDYQMGNVGSIRNMLAKVGAESVISGDTAVIAKASKLILPGVGAFDAGMGNIASLGLREVLDQKALKDKIPVLGICLGMQLLSRSSEEGKLPGLGWIAAKTVRFVQPAQGEQIRIPHMGWNEMKVRRTGKLFPDLNERSRFYFVHSFHVVCENSNDVVGIAPYGGEVAASIEHENILGTQFHPEKSHRFGMEVMRRFVGISC